MSRDSNGGGGSSSGSSTSAAGAAAGAGSSSSSSSSRDFRLAENANLIVKHSPDGSRGVFYEPISKSERKLAKARVLMKVEPLAVAIFSRKLMDHCTACLRALSAPNQPISMILNEPLRAAQTEAPAGTDVEVGGVIFQAGGDGECRGCDVVTYCSKECREADRLAGHTAWECGALRAFAAARGYPTKAQLQEDKATREKLWLDDPVAAPALWYHYRVGDGRMVPDPGEDIRALGRLLWRRKTGRVTDAQWQQFQSLQSNLDKLSPEQQLELGKKAMGLAFYLGNSANGQKSAADRAKAKQMTPAEDLKSWGFNNARELLDTICRFSINAFSAVEDHLTPAGVMLSPQVSYFNHSCMPNVLVISPTGTHAVIPAAVKPENRKNLRVVTLREIQAGGELLTSYLDLSEPLHRREQILWEQYQFKCTCAICKRCRKTEKELLKALNAAEPMSLKGLWMDPREAVLCAKRCGGWITAPYIRTDKEGKEEENSPWATGFLHVSCQACGAAQKVDLAKIQELRRDACRMNDMLEQKITRGQPLNAKEYEASVGQVLNALPKWRAVLGTGSYPLFGILQNLANSLVHLGENAPDDGWYKGTMIATLILAQMKVCDSAIFPPGHPVRGIHMSTVARFLVGGQPTKKPIEELAASLGEPSLAPISDVGTPARRYLMVEMIKSAIDELDLGFGASLGDTSNRSFYAWRLDEWLLACSEMAVALE